MMTMCQEETSTTEITGEASGKFVSNGQGMEPGSSDRPAKRLWIAFVINII